MYHPSRLRLAREWKGLSLASIKEVIGKSDEAIRRMEEGTIDATPYLEQFSIAYDVPVRFFDGPEISQISKDAVSFRTLKSIGAATRNNIIGLATIASQYIYPVLKERYPLPDVQYPELELQERTQSNPIEAAEYLRSYWRLGLQPVSSVLEYCERNGILVFWYEDESLKSDALSFWHDDRPFILINSKPISRQRQNFSLSHELGHLLLHRFDKPADNAKTEQEANEFAGSFMLPEQEYVYDAPKYAVLSEFLPVKAKWFASIQALIMRNYQLGIFSEWQRESAFKEIAIRKWRINEPGDLPAQTSLLHYQMLDTLRCDGVPGVDIADSIGINFETLCKFMPDSLIVGQIHTG